MMDIERYRGGLNHCAKMAGAAITLEIRELWLSLERSYKFLVEREERITRERKSA